MKNSTVNNKLDEMKANYGIEFGDYGFSDNMTNLEMMEIIKERELEIIGTLYNVEEEEAETLIELGTIKQDLAVEFNNDDDRKYRYLIKRRDFLNRQIATMIRG